MNISKPLSITWHVTIGILTVGIALAAINIADSRFETVVTALLLMLYAMSRAGVIANHRLLLAMSTAQLRQFSELAERLQHPQLAEFRETVKRDSEIYAGSNTSTLIEGTSLGIVWFAGLAAIISII